MTLFYSDDSARLYLGDCRELIPALASELEGAVTITDCPYGETSLAWDRWVDGWPALIPTRVLWCFGSMRMFLEHTTEFASWKFGQDVVWEKNNGSGFATDRFKRIHETAVQWYRGPWDDLCHSTPRVARRGPDKGLVHRRVTPIHTNKINTNHWTDDGERLMSSVIFVTNCRGHAQHPTQKPLGIISPLIEYSVEPGGLVFDPFAGSGSTGVAAKRMGRRAILIEADEASCEVAAGRLSQDALVLP